MIDKVLFLIGFLIFLYFLVRFLQKISRQEAKIHLSEKIKAKADWKFTKLLRKFTSENKRKPTKDELFRIIINASHITIRRRGQKGHWGRQKIRKYLLEKHGVVDNFKMK